MGREGVALVTHDTIELVQPLTVLAEDETIFRDSVRAFADAQVRPLVREMDEEAKIPRALIDRLFDLGVMGIEIPEAHGGAGGRFFHAVLAVEELSRVDPSIGVLVDVQNTLVINALLRFGHEDLRRRWLPALAAGTVGAYALSEAGSGSDAFALTTRAREDGDHYVLTGRKLWITNGNEANLFIVFATVNPDAGYRGITAFLVERGAPGFSVGRKEDKLGIRASSTCELIFEECRVPKAQILGEIGKGYKTAIETLNEGRIGIGAQMIGLARGALEHAIRYTKERRQFGKAIADFQGMQFLLADMGMKLTAARELTYAAAARSERGDADLTYFGAAAKCFASDAAMEITTDAVQVLGGYGYTKDFPAERMMRDAKITQIYEGTNQVQRIVMARQLLKGVI
jgi:alkylation response protein AidB-like acyl-CoA dehydrogenase